MKNKYAFKEEYKIFLKEYLLPLLGWSEEFIKNLTYKDYLNNLATVSPDYITYNPTTKQLFFGAHNEWLFYFNDIPEMDEEDFRLCKNILAIFIRIAQNGKSGARISLKSDLYQQQNYNFAIELGLCSWMAGGGIPNNSKFPLEQLISSLKKWSEKTYEGHRVCFGFLFDPQLDVGEVEYRQYGSFLTFLESDYSAVLSDGITSIIELDKNCEFHQYHSLTEDNKIVGGDLNNNLPYRFACIIEKYVTGSKVGIFLLVNGDIILAKKQSIYFIRRNSRWLNFKSKSFYTTIQNNVKKESLPKVDLLNQIFATAIDVSLSHTGGIIAVVDEQKMEQLEEIVDPIDLFSNKYLQTKELERVIYEKKNAIHQRVEMDDKNLSKIKEQNLIADLKSRLLKRNIVKALLIGDSSLDSWPNFMNIDRKLRAELIGLDGACILNLKGEPYSFGAIIQNESGSTGGGRGAAAKRLSKFNGFAIKISTDGYIEVYVNENTVYSIK